jgi:hypothetical protein
MRIVTIIIIYAIAAPALAENADLFDLAADHHVLVARRVPEP